MDKQIFIGINSTFEMTDVFELLLPHHISEPVTITLLFHPDVFTAVVAVFITYKFPLGRRIRAVRHHNKHLIAVIHGGNVFIMFTVFHEITR